MRVQRRPGQNEIAADRVDEFARSDHRASHDIAMPRCVLGEAVHIQIDIELPVIVESGQGVVEHRERTMRPGQRGDAGDVRNLQHWIGGAFEYDQPRGLSLKRMLQSLQIVDR